MAFVLCCLAASLPAAAQRPPAAPAPAAAAGAGTALRAGDVVEFDLSGLPSRYEGAGKAVCEGTVIKATGPELAPCERTYRFEVPPGDARMVFTFRATAGGRESRIEVPLTRARRPISFTAPADGALGSPAPVSLSEEAADRAAKREAVAQCGACRGGAFALKSFEITGVPQAADGSLDLRLKVTSKGGPARAK
jgi:hypothetical protein